MYKSCPGRRSGPVVVVVVVVVPLPDGAFPAGRAMIPDIADR